jgi:cellobiose-specific phosphotransferase system component IIA
MLVHAQDHLMTTIMYERVAKEFITLYKEKLS